MTSLKPTEGANELKQAYQNALALISQAKEHEIRGEVDRAKDAYFRTYELAKNVRFLWQLSFHGKREELVAELKSLDTLLSSLPLQSDIDSLWSQIESGLNGRMIEIYKGPEGKEWKRKQEQERHAQFEKKVYVLKRELGLQQTAQAIDILGRIGLELTYERNFDLPPQQRKAIEDLITSQRIYIEGQIAEGLSRSLSLPDGMLVLHDIYLDLGLYDNPAVHALGRGSDLNIQEKKKVTVKLNFDGKTGFEIVQFGFTHMHGYDHNITNERLVGIENSAVTKVPISSELAGTYQLSVYNPRQFPFTPLRGPETLSRTVERAQYIANQMIVVR